MQSIHKAVLLQEVVDNLIPTKNKDVSERDDNTPWYLDGTLGGAGHALAIAERFSGKVNIIGLDRDNTAIERARDVLSPKTNSLILACEDFRNLDKILEENGVKSLDMILFDLGLSSDELEKSGRGFTFQKDEPLLMTMGDPEKYPFTALDIVNKWDEEVIADIIYGYGEERFARRIARTIVSYRIKKSIERSLELAEIVKMSVPGFYRRGKIHPATKTFQALRIAVNDELGALNDGLKKGFNFLNKGGRMAVISFHSLEDRIVKEFFRNSVRLGSVLINKKPIIASQVEIAVNPRARSAKLRVIEK